VEHIVGASLKNYFFD